MTITGKITAKIGQNFYDRYIVIKTIRKSTFNMIAHDIIRDDGTKQ